MEENTINARSAECGRKSGLLAFLPLSERLNASAKEVRTTTILDYIVRTDTIQPGDDFASRKLADDLVRRLVNE